MTSTSLYAVRNTGGAFDKIEIILGAYSQLRISGITRSPTPEDLETALCRLENMAAEWDTTAMAAGYNFEDTPNPNSPSGLIRGYRHAFETNLAVKLIPDFNKEVPQVLLAEARQSLSNLVGRLAAQRVRQVDYPNRQPIGSGNSRSYSRWARFYRTAEQTPLNSTSISLFVGDTHDFTQHYDSVLNDGETVDSYSLVVDSGLTIESEALSSPDITYRVKGVSSPTSSTPQITVVATTSEGRVITRRHYVTVEPTGA